MNPYVRTEEELSFFTKEELISHIRWLYTYCSEIKQQYRDNIGRKPNVIHPDP